MISKMKLGGERWKIISVHAKKEDLERKLKKWTVEKEEGYKIIVKEDFNVRKLEERDGRRGRIIEMEKRGEESREIKK